MRLVVVLATFRSRSERNRQPPEATRLCPGESREGGSSAPVSRDRASLFSVCFLELLIDEEQRAPLGFSVLYHLERKCLSAPHENPVAFGTRFFYTPGTRILSRRSGGSERITAVCGSVTLI